MTGTRLRRDDGQMMTALVLGLGMAILAFVVLGLVPIGSASAERTQSQTAADAAALGAAEEIRTQWVYISTTPPLLRFASQPIPPIAGPSGSVGAGSLAAANRAMVTSYSNNPSRGEVSVTVRNTYAYDAGAGYAVSEAKAKMDANFQTCIWTPPVAPPPPPNGPPTFNATMRCGAWSASYVVSNIPGVWPTVSLIGTTQQQLFDDLEPRLID